MSFFGGSAGTDWLNNLNLKPVSYNPSGYNAYNPGQFGQNYQNATNQLMSGQLSPAQMQLMNQQFGQNLASVRESGFGMPSGAEKGLEYQSANQNALNAALLGQQNISQGLSAAMPYMNMGQNESQFGNNLMNNQSQFGTSVGLQNNQQYLSAQQTAGQMNQQDTGIFGGLVNAGLNKFFPTQQPNPYQFFLGGNQSSPENWNFSIKNPF